MRRMTVDEARAGLGRLIETGLRRPVTVTRDGKPLATVIGAPDLLALAQAFLPSDLQQALRQGRISAVEALLQAAERQQVATTQMPSSALMPRPTLL